MSPCSIKHHAMSIHGRVCSYPEAVIRYWLAPFFNSFRCHRPTPDSEYRKLWPGTFHSGSTGQQINLGEPWSASPLLCL